MERSSAKVLQWPDTSPENLVSPVLGKLPLMSQKLPRSVCIPSIFCSPVFVSRRISKETIEMGSSVRLSVRRRNEGVLCEHNSAYSFSSIFMFCSWSEDVHVVWIVSSNYFSTFLTCVFGIPDATSVYFVSLTPPTILV